MKKTPIGYRNGLQQGESVYPLLEILMQTFSHFYKNLQKQYLEQSLVRQKNNVGVTSTFTKLIPKMCV